MNKIKYWALPLVIFFGLIHTAHAGFEITEIMYDLDGTDTNREWVEVQNTGSDSADLSTWALFSDNTRHALVPQGASMVPSSGYAVIAQNVSKFQTDWPNYSGLLFDSSWTGFKNDGDTVALKDPALNVVGSVTYTSSQGGGGDGNSLQNVNGSWSGATPTPGAPNQSSSGGGGGGGGGGPSPDPISPVATTTPTPVVKKKEVEVPKITTNILVAGTVFAGLPFKMDAHTTGYKKEDLNTGRFIWNFGDGNTMTTLTQREFQYTYPYPGEYVVTLVYYFNDYSKVPEATDRMIIKVVPSQISISSVGTDLDPFVEIENKSDFELTPIGWIIRSLTHSFAIPEGTIILPKEKLKFSPKITGFNNSDINQISLQDQTGQIIAMYPQVKSYTSTRKNNTVSYSSSNDNLKSEIIAPSTTPIIDLNDLGANASSTDRPMSSASLAWIGLIIIIGVGLASVLVMRRKNNEVDSLEKEISASDMTIIE